ncbi:ATP-binding protein [Actinoallomurus sp. CA-150999]|uniref:ATP-binding protein n=1 Tax=Actinoallomurus sp. CA-150999 TaxID=3239887 RepID=UPI003D8C1EE1
MDTMGRAMIADSYSLKLGPHPGSAKVARLAVERRLQDWALPELLGDVHLVTTELVSNAARLGAVFELTISRPGERTVLVEVRDYCDGEPVLRDADPDEEGGRGLFIVQAFATEWGWRAESDGKTIWARCGG